MKKLILALCATVGLSASAAAQTAADVAAQYRAAQATFLPAGSDIVGQRGYIRDLLTGLQGDWVPASDIADGAAELDPALLGGICETGNTLRFEAPLPYRFTLSRSGRNATLTETYDLSGGTVFQKRIDDAEFISFMGIEDADPQMVASMLQGPNRFGPVVVFQPSDDIFVIQPLSGGSLAIYARCPSDAP